MTDTRQEETRALALMNKVKHAVGRAADFLWPGEGGPAEPGRILVLEQTAQGGWKLVEAEVSRSGISVLSARSIDAGERPEGLPARNGCEVALVPDARKAVCRLLELASAAPEQVQRMVALRLEVELPYPVADSTWVCEPRSNGAISQALLVASATADIDAAEASLDAWGYEGARVEFGPAGLAEWAAGAEGTQAIVGIEGERAVFVVTSAGSLCYTRHIRLEAPHETAGEAGPNWLPPLALELGQSIYDYMMRTGHAAPESLLLAGEGMARDDVREALEQRLELPVRPAALPVQVRLAKPELTEQTLLEDYPVCVGTLLALQRRLRGERSAAPALRDRKREFGRFDWRGRRGILAGLNVLLALTLVASVFGVHRLQRGADERLVEQSRPLLRGLEGLQEEVDILRFEEKRNRSLLDALQALAEALPPGIQIESLNVDTRGKMTLTGKASSVETASGKAIAALQASSAFVNPQFNGATKEKDGFGFQISFELSGNGRGVQPQ